MPPPKIPSGLSTSLPTPGPAPAPGPIPAGGATSTTTVGKAAPEKPAQAPKDSYASSPSTSGATATPVKKEERTLGVGGSQIAPASSGPSRRGNVGTSNLAAFPTQGAAAPAKPTTSLQLSGPIGMTKGVFQGDPQDGEAIMKTLNRYHREKQGAEGTFIGFSDAQMQALRDNRGNKEFWKTPQGKELAKELTSQIQMYQEDIGFQNPDGRIAPDQRTHQALGQLSARYASQDRIQAHAQAATAATAAHGAEIKNLPPLKPVIPPSTSPLSTRLPEEDVNRIANGVLLQNPINLEVQTTDQKTIRLDALEARDLYLNLQGFNSDGIATKQHADRGLDPFVRSGGEFGYTPEDGPKAAKELRDNALKRLESMGLNEKQFLTLMNDAQTLREGMKGPSFQPEPFEAVNLQMAGYDLKGSTSARGTGLLPTTRAKAQETDVSLKDLRNDPDPQIAAHTREMIEGAKDGHSYHAGLNHEDFVALDQATSARIGKALKEENAPKAVQDYTKLLELKAALDQGQLPDDLKKNLDVGKLNEKLNNPPKEVVDLFQTAQKDAVASLHTGPFARQGLSDRLQKHADYLTSDTFQQRLALYDNDGDRSKVIQAEMQALAAFDPALANKTYGALLLKPVVDDPVGALQSLSPADRKASIEKTLSQQPETKSLPLAERQAYAEKLSRFYEILPPGTSATRASEILDKAGQGGKGVTDLIDGLPLHKMAKGAETQKELNALVKDFEGLNAHRAMRGKMNLLSGTLAIGAVVTKLVEGNGSIKPIEIARDAGAGLKGVGIIGEGLEDIGKLAAMGKLAKAGGVLKFLGPVGDMVGLAAGISDLSDDLKRGDKVGAFFKGVGAASSLVGVAAGLIAISGGTLAPVVGAAAAVIGIGAWIGDQVWGESDNTLLKDLGVAKK